MTVPFWCLLVVILLPYVLSTTGGVYKTRQFGSLDNKNPRAQAAALTGTGARVQAAQANAWEALPVFTASVMVSHLAGADPGAAAGWSIGFVAARIAHAIFYVTDLDKLRSLAFLVGIACCIALFVISA